MKKYTCLLNTYVGFLFDEVTSDFDTFASGNDKFNRRLYEHFLRPRAASKSYVISPTSIALGLSVLAIGSQNNTDGVLRQLTNALSLPCNTQHLQQDLVHLKQKYAEYYHNEVFIDIFYDAERFRNVTKLDWSIARFADKFSIAIQKEIKTKLIHTYIKMDTSFGTSKFAISTFFNLNTTASAGSLEEDLDFFIINCANLTVFRVDFLHSR